MRRNWKELALFLVIPSFLLAAPTSPPTVTHIAAAQVEGAFAKGSPLLKTAGYKIHASRREKPGLAEVHTRDTDIVYVLQGTATLITGGTLMEGKPIAAEEIRGTSIGGGDTTQLVKGDVVVIPAGVPHQFVQVTNPFLYYVVKVDAEGSKR